MIILKGLAIDGPVKGKILESYSKIFYYTEVNTDISIRIYKETILAYNEYMYKYYDIKGKGFWSVHATSLHDVIDILLEDYRPNGLKDNEIAQLVNKVRDDLVRKLVEYKLPQCLRTIISEAVVSYLEEKNLRIDK